MTSPHAPFNAAQDAAPAPSGCPVQRLYGPAAESEPKELYEQLRRQHGQVAPVRIPGDVPAWLVLGHREVLDVLREPLRFSCDSRIWNVSLPADSPVLPVTAWKPLLVFTDGEEHKRLRNAITESLGHLDRRGLRRYVTRYANRVIDQFAHRGECDLVTDFAHKLPSIMLAHLFGIPEPQALPVGEAVRDMLGGSETALQSNDYVTAVMRSIVDARISEPQDDFASGLLAAGLGYEEVVEHLRQPLVAATVNTTQLVANALRVMLTDSRFRRGLSGGSMTLPDALDQVLWDASPLAVLPTRWATCDTELGGQQIKAGDMVMVGLAAGNVDPHIRPDLTTPMHGNRSYLSFGAGPHKCPGENIGRAIADAGIETLMNRLPDIQLAVGEDELTQTTTWMSSQLDRLPIRFTASPVGAPPSAPLSTPPAAAPRPAAGPVDAHAGDRGTAPSASWWKRGRGTDQR